MTLSLDPVQRPSLRYSSASEHPLQLAGTDCWLRPQVSLGTFTTYRVGGPAQWYAAPRSLQELEACLAWYQDRDLERLTFLGGGSNLLISDRGLPGLVINTRHLRHYYFDDERCQVTAGAGEPIARLAWQAAKRGWRGLEWAVGIPGLVGGSVVMNAGAHQRAIADVVTSVRVMNVDGTCEDLPVDQLGYSYRHSQLQGSDRLVLQATFQLQPDSLRDMVMAATNRNLSQRKNSQPYHLPSCGSVFRNPYPQAAGWLIEQAGLKGYHIGDAEVAERHANFILNRGKAKAEDIFRLIRHVQGQVEHQWSILLEPEVRMLGEFPTL